MKNLYFRLLLVILFISSLGYSQQPKPTGYVRPIGLAAKQPDGTFTYMNVDVSGNLLSGGAGNGTLLGQAAPVGYVFPFAPIAFDPSGNPQYLSVDANGKLITSGAVTAFSGVPTGSCTSSQTAVNTLNGDFYSCNSGVWLKVGPGAAGSVIWNSVTSPTGNMSLTMAAFTSLFTYNAATGAGVDLYKLVDTASNTGTGHILIVSTASSSAAKPVRFDANGNGVEMSTLGVLSAIGTGGINATQCSGAACGTITSIGVTAPVTTTGGATPTIALTSHGGTARVQLSDNSGSSGNIAKFAANGDIQDGGIAANNVATLAGPTFTGTVTMPAPTFNTLTGVAAQCLHVNTTGVVSGTGVDCGAGGGSTAWSALTNPSGNLSLSMTTNTTTFTWGNTLTTNPLLYTFGAISGATATDQFIVQDTTNNTTTGSLLAVKTIGTSTAKPITVTAQGTANGIQMSSAGVLAAIGSGHINADQCNGGVCGTVTSVAVSGPLTGSTITGSGTLGCTTCATTTNGGALSATAPISISAAGLIAATLHGGTARLQTSDNSGTSGNIAKFAANGDIQDGGVAASSVVSNPMTTLGDIITGGASGAPTRLAGATTLNGVPQYYQSQASGGVATAPTLAPAGVPVDPQSGSSYTVLLTDRTSLLNTTNNTTSTAVSIPTAGTTGFANNFALVHCNSGTVIATDTPVSTSTVNGNTTLVLQGKAASSNPECAFIWSDGAVYYAAEILPTDANGRLQAAGMPAFTAGDMTSTAGSLTGTVVSRINGTSFAGTTGDLVTFGASNTPVDSSILATNIVRKDAANTGAAAMTLDLSGLTGANAFKVPVGAGLTSGANGVVAYDSTGNRFHFRINAADAIGLGMASAPTGGLCLHTNGTTGLVTEAGADCGAGSSALNAITAAISSPTALANGNNPQTWNWAQTTDSQSAFTFGETSAATAGTLTNALANQAEFKLSTASASTATPLSVVQGSITGTVAFPAAQFQTTWNNASLTGMGLIFNVTDTLSATASLLMDLRKGNTSQFKVDKSGNITTLGIFTSTASGAGAFQCTAGSAPGHATASTITYGCPAAVTAYEIAMPSTAATGLLHWTNTSSVVAETISAIVDADISGTVSSTHGGFGAALNAAASGLYPKSNGGTPAVFNASTLAAAGVGSCTNQPVIALNGDAVPTCNVGTGNPLVVQGGLDATTQGSGGTLLAKGEDVTGGSTATLTGGATTLRGGDNASTGNTSIGGAVTVRGGDATGGTGTSDAGGIATIRGGNCTATTGSCTPGASSITSGGFTAAFTNGTGADNTFASGLGTGNAPVSHAKIQSPALSQTSGTTAQTQVTRYVTHVKAGSTTTATATNMFNIALANNQTAGVMVFVHVETTQGTPQNCSTNGLFFFVAQDTGGTVTQQTQVIAATPATICSTGTLTMTATASAAAPTVFSVTPSWATIVPTAVTITVQILNNSQQDLTLL